MKILENKDELIARLNDFIFKHKYSGTDPEKILTTLGFVFNWLKKEYGLIPYINDDDKKRNLLCVVYEKNEVGSEYLSFELLKSKKLQIHFDRQNHFTGKLSFKYNFNEKDKIINGLLDFFHGIDLSKVYRDERSAYTTLTGIKLQNFMSIKDIVSIDIKPITLFFGPNSAGKSAVLKALHYAREIFLNNNINPDRTDIGGESVDLGGFQNMVYNHDLSKPIIMQFDLNVSWKDLPNYNPYQAIDYYFDETVENDDGAFESKQRYERDIIDYVYGKTRTIFVRIKIEWKESINAPLVTQYETGINNTKIASIGLSSTAIGKNFYEINNLQEFHPIFPKKNIKVHESQLPWTELLTWMLELFGDLNSLTEGFSIPLLQDICLPNWGSLLPIDTSKFRGKNDERVDSLTLDWLLPEFLTSILTGPGEVLKNYLDQLLYLGPLRDVLDRNYTPGLTKNLSRWSSGLAAWDLLYSENDNFIDKINEWLNGYLETGYKLNSRIYKELDTNSPLYISLMKNSIFDDIDDTSDLIKKLPTKKSITFMDIKNKIELLPQDIGVGISQIMPIIVSCLATQIKFIAVEQPELHVHPAIQVKLGDLFISSINMKPGSIFILETHSEHLVLRLLRRIEETTNKELNDKRNTLVPELVSVNWFEPGKNGLEITKLPIDETGEFTKKWPRGFFEERAEELF